MIIHSPIISGSLTFADGSTFTLPDGGNYSGSFSGSVQISEIQSHLIPNANEQYDLGSAANRFRDLYLSNNTIVFPSGSFGFGSNGFGISDPSGNPAPFVTSQVKIADSVSGDIVVLSVDEGKLKTAATDSSGTAIADPSSNLSGSFTGSFTGLYDGVDIVTLNSNVDAILSGSTADKDSFAEIVTLINSVDTTNDAAFASFYTASNDRFETIEGFTSSIDTTIKTKLDADGIVSGSSQVTSLLPIGTVSGSVQVDVLQTTNFTEFSSSVADTFGGLSTDYNDLQNIPSGIISSSEQLAADFLDTLGDNVVSSSVQIDLTQTTNYASGIKLKLDAENVFSSSEQVTLGDVTGFNTFSSSVSDTFDGLSSNYEDLVGIPSGIVSGSSQIDVTATTNFSTVSSHISSTSNPHSVTKAQVGLGNVTNESKATMFTSPTFTGTVSGVSKAMVGLGSVDNTSDSAKPVSTAQQTALDLKANLASPTFTGTVGGVSKGMVGLGNVDNTSDANKPVSTAQQNALDTKLNINGDGVVSGSSQIDVTATTNYSNVSSHISSTSNPHSVTATQVGLGNVTNESKATMFDSPSFTGTVIAPTPTSNDSSTKVATTAYVQGEITDLIGGAGAAFDTLLEISASIANGDSDVVALTTTVSGKLQKDQNLSDLTNAGTARTNLGLGSLATLSTVNAATITDNSVGAAELNVSGNGTTAQFLRSDGDGTFTWATPTDTNTQLSDAQVRSKISGGTNISYNSTTGVITNGITNNNQLTNGAGYTTYTSNQATNTTSNVTFASVSATGDVVAYSASDRRLKDNVQNIEFALEKVTKLNGVTWDWNDNADELQKSLPNVGVIAQEVEAVLPQLIQHRDTGYMAVDYAKLTGLLIEAVKDLHKQVLDLESRLG